MLKGTVSEPQIARFTSSNAIIKDHYYYRGNDFKWNQPAAISEKFYPYYHKQKNENKEKIAEMQALENQDKATLLHLRREQILDKKEETRARYEQRVKENALIQRKSNQPVRSLPALDDATMDEETFDIIARKIDASKHLRSNEISWNHLHRASKKYVDQVLRPICTEREEQTMKGFKKRVDDEKKVDGEKLENRAKTHHSIRQIFLKKHEENYEKEKKVGTLPEIGTRPSRQSNISIRHHTQVPSIHIFEDENPAPKEFSRMGPIEPSLNTLDGTFKLKFQTSAPNLGTHMKTQSTIIDKLSEPRKDIQKEYTLDHTELTGMLIKNMDYKVYYPGNNFYDALTANNEFFKKTLAESRESRKQVSTTTMSSFRPKTSTTNKLVVTPPEASLFAPSSRAFSGATSYRTTKPQNKSLNQLPETKEVYDELDKFDNKLPISKHFGYSRIDLESLSQYKTKCKDF